MARRCLLAVLLKDLFHGKDSVGLRRYHVAGDVDVLVGVVLPSTFM